MPNLPHQIAVDRSRAIEPFTVPEPAVLPSRGGLVIHVHHGPLPGDPAHVLRPLGPGPGAR